MNSDNLINLTRKITDPLNSNRYIHNILGLVLITASHYFIPHPIIPMSVIRTIRNNTTISFLLTVLLAYLLQKDINAALVSAIVVFVLSHIVKKNENFENNDYVTLMINEYNYDLDRMVDKTKSNHNNKIGFAMPHQIVSSINNNPVLKPVNNISTTQIKTPNNIQSTHIPKKELTNVHAQIKNDFEFNSDNLRYLNYNPQKLMEFQDMVYNDEFTGNTFNPRLERLN